MARPPASAGRNRSRRGALVAWAAIAVFVAAFGGAAGAGAALPPQCAVSLGRVVCTYTATGESDFVVPAGVTSIAVTAVGAGGEADPIYKAAGGLGAIASGELAVAPGQTLYAEVDVGGGPSGRTTKNFASGGDGGGASDVRTCSAAGPCAPVSTLESRQLVAGGGGGTGLSSPAGGGAAGTPSPGAIGSEFPVLPGLPGTGATETEPGLGGEGYHVGLPNPATGGADGSAGVGGAGGNSDIGNGPCGGGGGGGWFGGGGGGGSSDSAGSGGGGGGGSSYASPAVSGATFSQAEADQDPAVTISYAATAPTITSAATASFAVGLPGSFTVGTSGSPTAAVSESGALPSGLTWRDDGDGTASIAGTSASGSDGSYPLTITADNGAQPAAVQQFTLDVEGGPPTSTPNGTDDPKDPVTAPSTVAPAPARGGPTAAASATPGVAGLTYRLSGSGSTAPIGHRIDSYVWTIAGKRIAGGEEVTHTFPRSGQRTPVTLTVGDDQGQKATTTIEVKPRTKPASVRVSVPFGPDRADPGPAGRRLLAPLKALVAFATSTRITGYSVAGEKKPESALRRLSLDRAQAVARFLLMGISRPRHVTVTGGGAAAPVDRTQAARGRRAVVALRYPKPLL